MLAQGKHFCWHIFTTFLNRAKKFLSQARQELRARIFQVIFKPATLHSFAGIKEGRSSSYSLLEQVKRNSDAVERWKNVDLLMIDEVSMLSNKVFDSIEFIARMLREKTRHFGGIQVIGSGDFYQLPPVPNPMNDGAGNFAFTSRVWNKVFPHTFILDKI